MTFGIVQMTMYSVEEGRVLRVAVVSMVAVGSMIAVGWIRDMGLSLYRLDGTDQSSSASIIMNRILASAANCDPTWAVPAIDAVRAVARSALASRIN